MVSILTLLLMGSTLHCDSRESHVHGGVRMEGEKAMHHVGAKGT